ncbi:unnamed protein product [Cylindrotheca closterium]|uniref:CCHC-type domain-containing protein n=1 Tax=Cylindrotheca closterium TaxID=2856 RepID=A0AAD2CCW6_9STRA|nr:unnamed protein product [Cylindrotheca closterium]
MGESNQRNSNKGSTLKKPKMTKEERRAKYTALARKRRDKQKEQRGVHNQRFGHNKQIVCFQCRKSGHTVATCPLNAGNEAVDKCTKVLCYKCGSTKHSLSECTHRDSSKELPYAKCFICGEMGHLSSHCSKNKKGIYVNGGSCRYCGSTEHLATDCNDKKKKKTVDPVGETDINDLLEKPKDAHASAAPPKKKKQRVVKF